MTYSHQPLCKNLRQNAAKWHTPSPFDIGPFPGAGLIWNIVPDGHLPEHNLMLAQPLISVLRDQVIALDPDATNAGDV